MKNIKQTLTTTRIEGVQPDTGTTIPPSTFVFTYAPDDGGYCKLYGLRYQLDNGGIDYKQFLGKPLDVIVTVTDPSGTTATTTDAHPGRPHAGEPRMKPFTRTRPRALGVARRDRRRGDAVRVHPAPPPPEAARAAKWQLLASELPSALLSVSGRSPDDMYAVGADKGARAARAPLRRQGLEPPAHGPERATCGGCRRFPDGPVLMAGAERDGAALRRCSASSGCRRRDSASRRSMASGARAATTSTPSEARRAATGSSGTTTAAAFERRRSRSTCRGWRTARCRASSRSGEPGDDVWVVGAGRHGPASQGSGPVRRRPERRRRTRSSRCTGPATGCVAVGGGEQRRASRRRAGTPPRLHDASPPAAGLIQGVFASDRYGDWASGERGIVYTRKGTGAVRGRGPRAHAAATSSLHSIFVDSAGGVWSAGGNVLTPALDGGCSFTTASRCRRSRSTTTT